MRFEGSLRGGEFSPQKLMRLTNVPFGSHYLLGDGMHLFVLRIVLLETLLITKVILEAEFLAIWTREICSYRVLTTGRGAYNHHSCVLEKEMILIVRIQ